MERRVTEAEKAEAFAANWDNRQPPSIQEWFHIAWARHIPEVLPMPPGIHLNLGQGKRAIGDAEALDLEHGWDGESYFIPHSSRTVAGIHANGFFEHLHDPGRMLAECQRVLHPGGVLNIVVPHGLSDLHAEDLTHEKPIVEDSWRNLMDNPYYVQGGEWKLRLHAQFIMGVVWRNLALFNQFVKER